MKEQKSLKSKNDVVSQATNNNGTYRVPTTSNNTNTQATNTQATNIQNPNQNSSQNTSATNNSSTTTTPSITNATTNNSSTQQSNNSQASQNTVVTQNNPNNTSSNTVTNTPPTQTVSNSTTNNATTTSSNTNAAVSNSSNSTNSVATTTNSSGSLQSEATSSILNLSSPALEENSFGKINGISLLSKLTTPSSLANTDDFSNCNEIQIPTNFLTFVIPPGCFSIKNTTITIPENSKLMIFTGTKLINSTLNVKGTLQILGTSYRNVELSNINIIPASNSHRVYLRWVNFNGGSFYANTAANPCAKTPVGTPFPSNFIAKDTQFNSMVGDIIIYQPRIDVHIINNEFKNSNGLCLSNSTYKSVRINYNTFYPASNDKFLSGYAIQVKDGPSPDEPPNTLPEVTTDWNYRNYVSFNSFMGKYIALKINFPTSYASERTVIDMYSNFWGTYNYNNLNAVVNSRVEGRYFNIRGECVRNCASSIYFALHDKNQFYTENFSFSRALTPVKSIPNTTIVGDEEWPTGKYTGPSTVEIPENTTLTISEGSTLKNIEFKVSGTLIIEGWLTREILLDNVKIRAMSPADTYSGHDIRISRVHMKGGSIYSYEHKNIFGSLYIKDSTFENLELPLYLANPKANHWIEKNTFIQCPPFLLANTVGTPYDAYIKISENTFLFPRLGTQFWILDLVKLNSYDNYDDFFEIKDNDFFTGANATTIQFTDKYANTRLPLKLESNYWLNESNGLSINDTTLMSGNSEIKMPTSWPISITLPILLENTSNTPHPHSLDVMTEYY